MISAPPEDTPRLDGARQALAGDPAMIQLASRIARGFGRNHPSLYEEFASATLYGLVLAALKTTSADCPAVFKGYAAECMNQQCLKVFGRELRGGLRLARKSVARQDWESTPEPMAAESDANRRFAELVEPLDADERHVLTLLYVGGHDQLEVAKMLACSDRKVWQVHDTALAKLRGEHGKRLAAGRAIMDARLAAGLSRGELARRMGKSLSYVKKVEAGQLVPMEHDALRLAEILGSPSP